jgi:hypothetical protein
MIVTLILVVVLWVVLLLVLLLLVVVVLAMVVMLVVPVVLVVLLLPLLLLALNVLLFLVLCAGVGALGASSAFAESMVTLTKSLQVVGSILLDLLRVDACADCCGVSCVCAYAKCLFSCFS